MNVFDIQRHRVDEYSSYAESFVTNRDPQIAVFVRAEYAKDTCSLEALVQLSWGCACARLRRPCARIAAAAGNDLEVLPSPMRVKLQEEYAKQHPDGAGSPSLRSLLDASYLTDLEKIARQEAIWPTFADVWGSKGEFTDTISDLTAFRNPMAHGRDVSEPVRIKGEAAVTWFEERLGI